MWPLVAWLFGCEERPESIAGFGIEPTLQPGGDGLVPAALLALAIASGAVEWYFTRRRLGSRWRRLALPVLRGVALAGVAAFAFNPYVAYQLQQLRPARIWVVADGTASMTLPFGDGSARSRADAANELTFAPETGLLAQIQSQSTARVELFQFGADSSPTPRRVSAVTPAFPKASRGLIADFGEVLSELSRQTAHNDVAAVVLISDFAHEDVIGSPAESTLRGGIAAGKAAQPRPPPIFTVGIGATMAPNVSVELAVDPVSKVNLLSNVVVRVRCENAGEIAAQMTVTAQPLGAATAAADAEAPAVIYRQPIALRPDDVLVPVEWTPREPGDYRLTATVEGVPDEIVLTDNTADQQSRVIGGPLRLLYVAFEPNWEWRFVKEVLARDPLVGEPGWRTYLAAADPRIRLGESGYWETLAPPRREFFASDVLVLGDMPRGMMPMEFTDRVVEFVRDFGGGLIVLAGPRFGLSTLRGTPLEALLPVRLLPRDELPAAGPFQPQRTPLAGQYSFMLLHPDQQEDQRIWERFGSLDWYWPVAGPAEQAQVLLQHPTALCADGHTPQPLLAVRRFGRGEVVYVAFDELWRLRRGAGEGEYRRFWSRLVYRLGMSHAVGDAKLFELTTDRTSLSPGQTAAFTLLTRDDNYQPRASPSGGEALTGFVQRLGDAAKTSLAFRPIADGVYQAQTRLSEPGDYLASAFDATRQRQDHQLLFVRDQSAERRHPARNADLAQRIANQSQGPSAKGSDPLRQLPKGQTPFRTGSQGHSFAVESWPPTAVTRQIIARLPLEEQVAMRSARTAICYTPFWFALVIGALFAEWIIRRWSYLP